MTAEMMGEKTILVGVDFGPCTKPALAYAVWLAKNTEANKIFLLHVIDYSLTPPAYLLPYLEFERARLSNDLKPWIKKIEDHGIPAEGRVVVGRIVETFNAVLTSTKACAIVLGYKSHPLRPSSSERLIKSIQVPLLVIRGDKAMNMEIGEVEIKRILCATDFSQHSVKAVEFAKAISEMSGADMDILHVIDPLPSNLKIDGEIKKKYLNEQREEAQRKMASLVGGRPDMRNFIREGIASEIIAKVAEETDASMLFSGVRGLSHLKGILLGSVADALIKSSPCPVMIVH